MKRHFLDVSQQIKWENTAVEVINDKIEHFKKTGNKRKLEIYEAKLKSKPQLISGLKKVAEILKIRQKKEMEENLKKLIKK